MESKSTGTRSSAQLIGILLQVAGIWVLADVGYYLALPQLGVRVSYNAGSIAIALYYAFWVGIAVITFWPVYARWTQHGRWETFSNRVASYIIWSLSFTGSVLFAAYLLPLIPPIEWTQSFNPPDVRTATPWYFLPKSIDIAMPHIISGSLFRFL